MFLQEARSYVWIHSIESLNATNLFLAMLSVVTLQVTEANYIYWAYVLNPPINTGVSWEDMNIPVAVNESSWLSSSYDNQGPMEGKEIINYIVGV